MSSSMETNKYATANKIKTVVIALLFIALTATIGYIYGKAVNNAPFITALTTVIAGIFVLTSYVVSDKIILRLIKARRIQNNQYPLLFKSLNEISSLANVPPPNIYTIHNNAINAFATGRNPKHASICFTQGCLSKLSTPEIEGVLAHELSHIKNYDILPHSFIVPLIGFPLLAPFGIALGLLSPLIAVIMHVVVPQKREYIADAAAVLLTKYPEALASALEKVKNDKSQLSNANLAIAHLFIANPFTRGKKRLFSSMFNIHPSINERLSVLRSL